MITLLFWGSLVVSVLAAVFALRKRSWSLMLVSLIAYLPFALYLSMTPRFYWYFVVIPFPVIAVVALAKPQPHLVRLSIGVQAVLTVYVLVMLMI